MADDRFVTTRDGVRLHASLLGTGSRPVIVPGTGNEADFEDHFASHFVVFFDIRNRGRSDSVPDSGHVGLPVEVDDIDDVRAAFGFDRCSLFAWSYPALVAALYAARHPGRVDRLILSCPPPSHANVAGFFTARGRQSVPPAAVTAGTAAEARAQRRELARSLMWNSVGVERLRSDPGCHAERVAPTCRRRHGSGTCHVRGRVRLQA